MATTRKLSELPGELLPGLVAQINAQNAALAALGALPHHDKTEPVVAAAATDLATSIALVNDVRAKYVAHIADEDAHEAADSTNTVSAAAATDLTTVIALANELKGDLNAHVVLEAAHRGIGGAGGLDPATVTTADATDQATANDLCNALKAACNRHFGAGAPDLELVAS